MEHRRLGRLGRKNSVLIFGGAALGEVTQDVADAAIHGRVSADVWGEAMAALLAEIVSAFRATPSSRVFPARRHPTAQMPQAILV